jgi:phage terminase large subunit-like protein
MTLEKDYWRTLRDNLKHWTPQKKREWITSLSDAEIAAIPWWLVLQARDKQIPPEGDWSFWLCLAGRGFGKTNMIAEFAHMKADAMPGSRGLIMAPTAGDARDVVIEGLSGIVNTGPIATRPTYNPSKRLVTWPNGTEAHVRSADSPDRLRGPQCHWFVADELAVWRYGVEAWDMLMFGFRLGDNPQGAIATTPKNCKVLREVMQSPGLVTTRGTTYENRDNLSAQFFTRIITKYEGTRLGRQELNAELLEDNERALWKREWIEATRKLKAPDLVRVGVAMDPAATSGEKADDGGIIGGGIAPVDGMMHGDVLEGATTHGTPNQQAQAAITLYHKLKADVLIAEANNGGEWIPTVIHNIDKSVNVKIVHASRGKHTRSEPISSLYEHTEKHHGRIHHVGAFAMLEDEYCQWEPGEDSPNRLDAGVWLFTELLLTNKTKGFIL